MDPFIDAIEAMKRSVAPVACLTIDDRKFIERRGSAFFVTAGGAFVTAAQVVQEIKKSDPPCPVSAVALPLGRWQPDALNEALAWFRFQPSNCSIDTDLDVAKCPLMEDLSSPRARLPTIVPVTLESSIPPDGTQVAFTGFPTGARDPMTVRADVVAYRPVRHNERIIGEIVLDRAAWPGFSGSPVYLSDGRVIGIVVAGRTDEGTALTILRPVLAARTLFIDPEKK